MLEILLAFQLLTCSEYDFFIEGVRTSNLTPTEKVDLYFEFYEMTEPKCFESKDAND